MAPAVSNTSVQRTPLSKRSSRYLPSRTPPTDASAIGRVVVDPTARGHGLSRALLRRGIEFSRNVMTVRLAQDMGIAVLINRPYQAGRLFRAVAGRELPAWAAGFAASWGQFFLKFIISHPAVTCVIPATSKPHHMVDNLGAGFGNMPEDSRMSRHASQAGGRLPVSAGLILVVLCFLWGAQAVSIKFSNQGMPPLMAGALRSLVAGFLSSRL